MYSADPTDPVAEEMLKEILPEIGENTGENIRNTHPRTQIQWKIAPVLAWRKASSSEQRVLANRLMDTAADTLLQNEFSGVFAAIAVGILAERAYHIKAGNIPGNLNHVLKKLAAAYEQFTQRKDTNSKDPFAPLMILESGKPEQLLEISKIIGY